MMEKFVYLFDEGNGNMRDLLGGKGANLAEMTRIGLPVPFGFTITTQACSAYYEAGKKIPKLVETQTIEALNTLEDKMGKRLGDPQRELLFNYISLWDLKRREHTSERSHSSSPKPKTKSESSIRQEYPCRLNPSQTAN